MFRTTLWLDLDHQLVAADTRDVCRMHSRVVDATTGMPDTGPRVLWATPQPGLLVIRAPEPVTASRLPREYALRATVARWEPPREPGRYSVAAVVNPGKHKRRRDSAGATVHTLVSVDTPDGQRDWLERVLGVSVDRFHVTSSALVRGRHRTGRTVWTRHVVLAAEVKVTTPGPVCARALAGVGVDKAWGCGLTVWEPL